MLTALRGHRAEAVNLLGSCTASPLAPLPTCTGFCRLRAEAAGTCGSIPMTFVGEELRVQSEAEGQWGKPSPISIQGHMRMWVGPGPKVQVRVHGSAW